METTEKHSFKKGQQMHLDEIYDIQGLADGDWWDFEGEVGIFGPDDDIKIVEDIEITITVKR